MMEEHRLLESREILGNAKYVALTLDFNLNFKYPPLKIIFKFIAILNHD